MDKFYAWPVKWNLLLNLNKCQRFMEREASLARHMGPPGHWVTMEQTQQARNLEILMSEEHKHSLRSESGKERIVCLTST